MQKFIPSSLGGNSDGKGVSVENFKAGFVAKKHSNQSIKQARPKTERPTSAIQKKDIKAASLQSSERAAEPEKPKKVEVKEKTYLEKDLQDARTKGYEEGYAKGYSAAKQDADDINKKTLETIDAIQKQLAKINVEKASHSKKLTEDVTSLSLQIARKISEVSLQQNQLQEIEKTIEKTLGMLFDEPKIIINVSGEVANFVNEKIKSIKEESGFLGDVEVLPDQAMDAGSCNIQWQSGGAVHDKQEIWGQINAIIESSMGLKQTAPAQ